MQVYLVGGAIRDRLLGLPAKEQDYVVVGATPEAMRRQGFKQVGQDFPVFLHPHTHEEYALARTFRSAARAGAAAEPHADPAVTLEEDLARRDLTINAIAQHSDGGLIDPFGGRADLRERILRHVSPAFEEDPIRVLRVARFMARYRVFGFRVAEETLALMQRMTAEGALDDLVPERIWQELSGALQTQDPTPFFHTLRNCGALARILPELDRLWGVPQSVRAHPEVDCGLHTMLVLQMACGLSNSLAVRFAALTHDLGKGVTSRHQWPRHPGHEAAGARLVEALCTRLRVPNRCRMLARHCANEHGLCHKVDRLSAEAVLELLHRLDAFRRVEILEDFLLVCEADYRGRRGYQQLAYPQAVELRRLYQAARDVDRSSLRGISGGEAIGRTLDRLRRLAIEQAQAGQVVRR